MKSGGFTSPDADVGLSPESLPIQETSKRSERHSKRLKPD